MTGTGRGKILCDRVNGINQEWLDKAQYVLHNPQILRSWLRGLRNSLIPDVILSHLKPTLLNAYLNTALRQMEGQNSMLWQRPHFIFCTDEKGNVRNLSLSPDVNQHVEEYLRKYIVDLFDRENFWEDAVRWYFNNSVVWTLEAMTLEHGKGISSQSWANVYSKTLCYAGEKRFYNMFDIYAKNFVDLFMKDFPVGCRDGDADNLVFFEEVLGLNEKGTGYLINLELEVAKEKPSYLTTFSMANYQQLRKVIATQSFNQEENNWPCASLQTPSGSSQGYAQLRMQEGSALVVGELLEGMNDETVDVCDALCHLWLKKGPAQTDKIVIHADDILEIRGLRKQKNGQGQRGGYKREWRERIEKHLNILDHLWIAEDFSASPEKAFIVAREKIDQKKGKEREYAWEVRPGDILLRDLQGGRRQTALLSEKVLELDPYRQSFEKRAARYFSWLWRNRQYRVQYLNPIRVTTLLDAVQMEYTKSRGAKTIERFEKMLDVLKDKQIIASWQYDKSYEKIKEWADLKIVVEPPQIIMDQYAKIKSTNKNTKRMKPEESLPPDLGEKLKKERLKRRLTQLQAAEQIGIAQTTLSKIELGRRKPDQRTLYKLLQWLSIST